MKIIPYKAFWMVASSVMLLVSVIAMMIFGFRLSSDFTEGTVLAIQFPTSDAQQAVTQEQFRTAVESYVPAEGEEDITGLDLKASGSQFIMRTKRLSPEQLEKFLAHLEQELGDFELLQTRD